MFLTRHPVPEVSYVMPCWMSPELLAVSIPSLIESLTVPSQIIVILNDYDRESIEICRQYNVEFIASHYNYGPAGVDFAVPMLRGNYVCNVNSDMLFYPGWDKPIVETLNNNPNLAMSPILVEPTQDSPWVRFNGGGFNKQTNENFITFINADGPNHQKNIACGDRVCYNHPIFVRRDDHLHVGGYSNNFNREWMKIGGGRGMDDDYAFRLWHKLGYSFLATWDSFVYHGVSLNARKDRSQKGDAYALFEKQNGMTISDFHQFIKYWKVKLGSGKVHK